MSSLLQIIFFALLVRPLLAFFIGVRVRGLKELPRQHPFIIVANHTSHLDAVALLNLFPLKDLARIRPVAAADYFHRNAMVAWFSHCFFNILPIERQHISREHNPLPVLREALMRGESLIIFPEGTRSVSGDLGAFHSGIAHMIQEFPQIPVIPVFMSNMGRALPKGEFILLPFICEVNIGTPVFVQGSKEDILNALRDAFLKLRGESSWSR